MWDPVLLIAQIVSVQSLHYLTLGLVLPPLLVLFTNPIPRTYYDGGPATVGMIMDWREMAGRPTIGQGVGVGGWNPFQSAWNGVVRVSQSDVLGTMTGSGEGRGIGGWRASLMKSISSAAGSSEAHSGPVSPWPPAMHNGGIDPMRGWIIAASWIIACSADIYFLYTLVRRPTYILDFALTLVLIHFILTSYYSSSLPSSLFFWAVMFSGAILVIVVAEQLCIRREMREGLKGVTTNPEQARDEDDDERIELVER